MSDDILFRPLGHVIFVRDCPLIVVLNKQFGHWAFLMFLTCIVFALFFVCSHISCCCFPRLQGGHPFASKFANLRDPELRNLAEGLPLCAVKAKASATMDGYSRLFQKFREWSSSFEEINCLPSDEMTVSLYLESLFAPHLNLPAMV